MRVKFKKGMQRKFLERVLKNTDCPSLRSLISRGFNVNYSTLKSYFNENRTLPEGLFRDLCTFSSQNPDDIEYTLLNENWGQSLGGKN